MQKVAVYVEPSESVSYEVPGSRSRVTTCPTFWITQNWTNWVPVTKLTANSKHVIMCHTSQQTDFLTNVYQSIVVHFQFIVVKVVRNNQVVNSLRRQLSM